MTFQNDSRHFQLNVMPKSIVSDGSRARQPPMVPGFAALDFGIWHARHWAWDRIQLCFLGKLFRIFEVHYL